MTWPRVLLLTGEYPPNAGGIADYTALLHSALSDRAVDSFVMSSRGTSADVVVDDWSWKTIPIVRNAVQRLRIDIVHLQYQAGAFDMHPALNALPILLRDTPVVTTFHDLRPPYLFPKAGRLRCFTMRRMARSSVKSIVTNPRDERTLTRPGVKISRLPLGPSLPPPANGIEARHSVGYFGFPSRQKGFDLLVGAIGAIPERERPALIVVGGSPPVSRQHGFMTADDVRHLAARHAVVVTRTGFLRAQDASNALAACAVLAFPFPGGATQRSSALIAALQSGRPVITATPPQAGDLAGLSDLPQLVLIPPIDPAALRDAIVDAITSPPAWRPLPNEYAWTSIAERHAELYRALLREVRH